MECKWASRLNAYLDGELPDSERAEFQAHLQNCAECSVQLAESQCISSFLCAAKSFELSHLQMSRLHNLPRRDPLLRLSQALAAVAATIMLASGLCLFRMGNPDSLAPGSWESVAVTQKLDQGDGVDPVVQVLLREQP